MASINLKAIIALIDVKALMASYSGVLLEMLQHLKWLNWPEILVVTLQLWWLSPRRSSYRVVP